MVIGEFDIDPIFGRQNSPQFLIDPEAFKPSEVNAVLGAFGGTERLERGKKEANLRKSQGDSEAKALAAQIRGAEERKAALAVLKAGSEKVADRLLSAEKAVRALEAEGLWLGAAARAVGRLGRSGG